MLFTVFKILAKLPLSILYLFSSFLYPLALILYRRKVVNKNIKKVFPNKSKVERIKIIRRFYRNVLDMMFETIKLTSISEEELNSRVSFEDNEALKQIKEMDSPILFYTTHLFNWEWLCAACQMNVFQAYPLYKPLKNKEFDSYIYNLRARFGTIPLSIKDSLKHVLKLRGLSGIGLLADQSPPKVNKGRVWAKFFDNDTSFYNGVINLPYLTKVPCYFAEISREKRGYYKVTFKLMSKPPYKKGNTELFQKYIQLTEEAIRKNPDNWLWTHDRWKYKRKDFEEIIIFQ